MSEIILTGRKTQIKKKKEKKKKEKKKKKKKITMAGIEPGLLGW